MPQQDGVIGTTQIRIAVIDDERILLNVFSSLMKQFGYQADFFSNPLKALETISASPERYHLVITDIRMPEMDGLTFVQKVRFLLPNIPIIFMTGEAGGLDSKETALALGNVEFLEKPFPLEATLREVIPRLLGRPKKG